ncbi:MAG: hypothetical protein ACTSQV_05885, partial [Alphaproteobacteria bacterium]
AMTDLRSIAAPLAAVLALSVALPPAPATALTPDEVRQRVAAEYGVRVLKVKPATLDGRAVFRVTVINPGGDFNTAFQVNIIAFDAATGEAVSAFRHLPSGRRDNQAPSLVPNRQPADAFRRGRAWR